MYSTKHAGVKQSKELRRSSQKSQFWLFPDLSKVLNTIAHLIFVDGHFHLDYRGVAPE